MSPRHGRFARRSRLTHPTEFRKVFQSPVRSEDEIFLLIARKNGLEYPRLGVSISCKRVKGAVTRNRLKRLIRESFRRQQGLLDGLDIVVTVTRNHARLDSKSINKSLNIQWGKLVRCAG